MSPAEAVQGAEYSGIDSTSHPPYLQSQAGLEGSSTALALPRQAAKERRRPAAEPAGYCSEYSRRVTKFLGNGPLVDAVKQGKRPRSICQESPNKGPARGAGGRPKAAAPTAKRPTEATCPSRETGAPEGRLNPSWQGNPKLRPPGRLPGLRPA